MLATGTWIYLDLEKTGCTFLRERLLSIYPEHLFLEKKKHGIQENESAIPKLITIREPCRYYFSLWSYGLEGKGGFYKKLSANFPALSERAFADRSKDSFAWFLDFALNTPTRYPSGKAQKWIPTSCDIYTARILSMLVPKSCRTALLKELKSPNQLATYLVSNRDKFLPRAILRTESLNNDFHDLAHNGHLSFMQLPADWEERFPLNAQPINTSSNSHSAQTDGASTVEDFYSDEQLKLVNSKSSVYYLLRSEAEKNF